MLKKQFHEMKKRIFNILGVIIGIVTIYTLYINSSFYIENQDWKHGEGTHIGDWLGKNSFIVNDGIIQTDIGKAKIIFSYGRKLIIESLDSKERGLYFNKS
ncbi:hypothetical protein [Psychroserpens algicola]|uniref:Uncharacterized protein n=1 Tax=Psychroserpens algicola TaxID=1719034 RepID=A0ABT0HD17_9FLAO|nr:hypothetical protein [Psychroserpens algicola]MCK8482258.1 hypothetical protein [Psychroserpens algicola]